MAVFCLDLPQVTEGPTSAMSRYISTVVRRYGLAPSAAVMSMLKFAQMF